MATSGTYEFTTSAANIVRRALLRVGAAQENSATAPVMFVDTLEALNQLIKHIAAKNGRHLWRRNEVIVFLDPSQPKYFLGSKSTDAEWCLASQFTQTNLDDSASADATSLTVDSTAGLRAGDRLGLELSNTTRFWTNIISIDTATTLTVPAISSAASDNATVYTYTTGTTEVLQVQTLFNGSVSASGTTFILDSTTGMADGDRVSYVATDDTTVFTKITTVDSATNLTVPGAAKAIDDNALLQVFKTDVEQGTVVTALNGAASANAETLKFDSTSGITNGDVISVVATDKSIMWMAVETLVSTTIVGIAPLVAAASDNAVVTIYKLKPPRPLKILHASRQDGTGADIPIDIEGQEEYRNQPNKTTTGTPVFITYKPSLGSGELEVWQPPANTNMLLKLSVSRPFEIFAAGANEPDIPEEWHLPLVHMLAKEIEPEYRLIGPQRQQSIRQDAQESWNWVNNFDDDEGSIYIMPEAMF